MRNKSVVGITSVLAISMIGISFFPKESSADMFSILSSVFESHGLKKADEIQPVDRNIQTMNVLSAARVPDASASSSAESRQQFKVASSMVGGEALTNENAPTVKGETDLFDKDISSNRISLYTVRKGDTLEQIARMYGVNVNTILWANDMKKGTPPQPDQVLVIMPISSVQYTVKKGDTLESIAKLYGSDINEIAQFNSFEDGAKLAVGTQVIIPDAEGSLTVAENKKNTNQGKPATDTKKPAAVTTASAGYFSRPIKGGVRTQGIHGGNGVDLASSLRAPIYAAAAGRVVIAKEGGWNGGYGSYVVIQHPNGMQTLYAHMDAVDTSVGATVAKGQQIGKMGNTGRSTGVHLHFEVRGGRNPF